MNEYGYGADERSSAAISEGEYNTPRGQVFLPHSCDDWCIGDADNVRLMIADLEALLLELQSVASPKVELKRGEE